MHDLLTIELDEVDVIEVLVAEGDTVAKEDSLITLESDKASMDIPSPTAGVVKSVDIVVGDKVSKDGGQQDRRRGGPGLLDHHGQERHVQRQHPMTLLLSIALR